MIETGGHPQVSIQEIDLSTRVPGFPGVYGAMVIPAKMGPIDTPRLATSETQLLNLYTPNGKVEIGYDLGYFSSLAFLQKANKLWIRRVVATDALVGGAAFQEITSETVNAAWVSGEADPTARVAGADEVFSIHAQNPGEWSENFGIRLWLQRNRETIVLGSEAGNISHQGTPAVNGVAATATLSNIVFTAKDTGADKNGIIVTVIDNQSLTGNSDETFVWADPTHLNITVKVGVTLLSTVLTGLDADPTFSVALLEGHAGSETATSGTATTSGGVTAVPAGADTNTIKTDQYFVSGEPVRLLALETGVLPTGLEANRTYYTIEVDEGVIALAATQAAALAGTPRVDFTSAGTGSMQLIPLKDIKQPGGIQIEVYRSSNENYPIETFIVSRTPGAKDTKGQNMYIEDVFEGSNYLRVEDNPLVLGNPRPQVTILYLGGGDDGGVVTDGRMILGADDFTNNDGYPVTCLMDGGWATPAYQKQLDTIAQGRHDCVALLSTPYNAEASANYLNELVDYRKNILNLSSSHSALYTPHVKVYDKYNDRAIFASPDGYAGAAISYTAYNYEMWYPPAGFKRGQLNVLDCRRRFSKAEMDFLYNNDINPIRFYPGKGIVIWGQKTLLGQTSALDRLNVRLLLIVIEPAIAKALETFLFELNNADTRRLAKAMIDDYMEGIKGRKGVYEYITQCDEDNNTANDVDNHIMNVHLFIKPTADVEYIPFTVVIMRSGMSFQLAQDLV